jgi:hypothetical protein
MTDDGPRTEAGRRLLDDLVWTADVLRKDDVYLDFILAIEAEASGLDEAWNEAEKALPLAGWTDPIDGRWVVPNGAWSIAIRHAESGDGYFEPAVEGFWATAHLESYPRPFAIRGDLGPSPAEALHSLTAALQAATPVVRNPSETESPNDTATPPEDDPWPDLDGQPVATEVGPSGFTVYDEADDMCPNCITPWKCNGPHQVDRPLVGPQEA